MQFAKTYKIIISILAVAVLLFIYIAFDQKAKQQDLDINTTTNQIVATSTSDGKKSTGNYKIEQVPLSEGEATLKPIPDLNRPVTTTSGALVSTEAIVRATEMILPLQAGLKKNPSDLYAWIDLGIYQKMAGDYQGALISWMYASGLYPADYITLGNLGNLYAYYLKDNSKAEMYYIQAIKKGPTQINLYVQFAEVYRDLFRDIVKARSIVEQGLLKIPNDPNLLQLKASLAKP